MPVWSDWAPGVLSKRQIQALTQDYMNPAEIDSDSYGSTSLDLHISEDDAFALHAGSCKPTQSGYQSMLRSLADARLATRVEPKDGWFNLTPGSVTVFKLKERIGAFKETPIHGQATAKSSVGRLDILARLIADAETRFERFAPDTIGNGQLHLEVLTNATPVRIRAGSSLNQLRLFYGEPKALEVSGPAYCQSVNLATPELSIDLSADRIGGLDCSALQLEPSADGSPLLIDNAPPKKRKREQSDPCKFMRLLGAKGKRLTLTPGKFYLVRSKERLRIPKGLALYCIPGHEGLGEMRIHYAGFIHPWFGYRADGEPGTPLIFELRAHQAPISLADGEVIGNLSFYRLSEDEEREESTYEKQVLRHSALLADFPAELRWRDKELGIVEMA